MTDRSWLVADLGGTNARFAIADPDTRTITDEVILSTAGSRRVWRLRAWQSRGL